MTRQDKMRKDKKDFFAFLCLSLCPLYYFSCLVFCLDRFAYLVLSWDGLFVFFDHRLWLSGGCLVVASWLPCLVVVLGLSCGCPVDVLWLSCLVVVLWFSCSCLVVVLWLSCGCLVLWLSCGCPMVVLWLSCGCFIMSCLVVILWLSCLVLSCLVLSCLVLSCLALPCLVLSSLVLPCLVLSSSCKLKNEVHVVHIQWWSLLVEELKNWKKWKIETLKNTSWWEQVFLFVAGLVSFFRTSFFLGPILGSNLIFSLSLWLFFLCSSLVDARSSTLLTERSLLTFV